MHVVNWREQIDSWWRRNAEKQTDNFCSLWIMQNILPRCEGFRGEAVECSERPTYTSCQSSCFAHWRRAHSAQRVAPDCEPPLPRLWTCSGCLCWGCWHSDGLTGPRCYDSPPHGGLCRPTTPASWLLGQLSRRRNLSIKNDPPFGSNRAEQSPSVGGVWGFLKRAWHTSAWRKQLHWVQLHPHSASVRNHCPVTERIAMFWWDAKQTNQGVRKGDSRSEWI